MPANIYHLDRALVMRNALTQGKDAQVFVALLPKGSRVPPISALMAVGAAGAAKSAVSVPLASALPAGFVAPAGAYLNFVNNATGEDRMVQLAADAVAGATALTVVPIPEALPSTGTWKAEYPTYCSDRTDSSINRQNSVKTTKTYNTGGAEDGVDSGSSSEINLPGPYYYRNAGYATALYAQENGREIWVRRQLAAPSTAYRVGMMIEGPALVTASPSAAPVEGEVGADLTLKFLGKPDRYDPVPTV